jgi:hypothetical protein
MKYGGEDATLSVVSNGCQKSFGRGAIHIHSDSRNRVVLSSCCVVVERDRVRMIDPSLRVGVSAGCAALKDKLGLCLRDAYRVICGFLLQHVWYSNSSSDMFTKCFFHWLEKTIQDDFILHLEVAQRSQDLLARALL